MTANSQLLQIAEEDDDAFKFQSNDFMSDDISSPESYKPVVVEIDKQDIQDYDDDYGQQSMASHVRRAEERAAFGLESDAGNMSSAGGRERGNARYMPRGGYNQSHTQSGVSFSQEQSRAPGRADKIQFDSQMKDSNMQSTGGSRVQGQGFGESAFGAFDESIQAEQSVYQGRQYSQMSKQSNMNDPFLTQSRTNQHQSGTSQYGNWNQEQSKAGYAQHRGQNDLQPNSYNQSSMKSKAGVDQSYYSREEDFSSQVPDMRTGQKQQNMGNSKMSASGMSQRNRAPVGFNTFGSIQGSQMEGLNEDDFAAFNESQAGQRSRQGQESNEWQMNSFHAGNESSFSKF